MMWQQGSSKGNSGAGKCGACGSVLPAGSRFCASCGEEQQDELGISSADEVFGLASEVKVAPAAPRLSTGSLVAAVAVVALLALAIGWGVAQLGKGARQPAPQTSVTQAQPATSQRAVPKATGFGVPVGPAAGVASGAPPAAAGPPVLAPPALQKAPGARAASPSTPRERTGRQLASRGDTASPSTAASDTGRESPGLGSPPAGTQATTDERQTPYGEPPDGRSSAGQNVAPPDWAPSVTTSPRDGGMSLTPKVPGGARNPSATRGR